MSAVIKVENVSKAYQLGQIGTGTISQDLARWFARMRGKEDPFLKIGEANDRTVKSTSGVVWSLKDINFEVEKGNAVGIIGKNGAGKSTLLKILSKVTAPTTGSITGSGRIASLLEVGTGFHPELTGRENIYLNGAILGMRKKEIIRKFDEIVDFSGVDKYIDTPVKRYSSGMYVRLAFAVAAHLESEILIVDEVLAVGDAEFQKKCLGKMGDVMDKEGRTILFVSHNMNAIKSLCTSVLFMHNGGIMDYGGTNKIINKYLALNIHGSMHKSYQTPEDAPGNDFVKMKRIEVCPLFQKPTDTITVNTNINIEFEFWNYTIEKEINLVLHIYTMTDECVFACSTDPSFLNRGLIKAICEIPANLLNDGQYKISMLVVKERSYGLYFFDNVASFEVNEERESSGWHGKWPGLVRPKLNFKLLNA
jgi:lipopolysaccharide transport system ATP-binding protein